MSSIDFIDIMNEYAGKDTPFFFLVDFEMIKPIVIPLSELINSDISFSIDGKEYGREINTPSKPVEFTIDNASFNDYFPKFKMVENHILSGDTYLLNLTEQTKLTEFINLEQVYNSVSSPFKLLKKNDFISFSPEKFITIFNNNISSFPMKGTISATVDDAENKLLNDEKELFEHYTIVDLIRNDLSIVSTNISVERFRYIDTISTATGDILQTSSKITGNLPNNWKNHLGSIIHNMLPAGSISGAPKQRSVEIIEVTESIKRGYYTGVCGIFDGNSVKSSVIIRYIENIDGISYYRSGGGITNKSIAEDEFDELIKKIYAPII